MAKLSLKSYSKSIFTYFGASFVPLALNLMINPLIAMNMTPRDYAVTGYFTSFGSLISPIISFYFIGYYLKEYFRLDEEGRDRLYCTIAKALIFISGALSIVCFAALFAYMAIFKSDLEFPVMPYLAMMVFALPVGGLLGLELAKCRIKRDSKRFFRYSVVNGCLGVALTLFFVVTVKWGAFGKLLAPLLCNLVVFLYLLHKNRFIFRQHTALSAYRKIMLFCLPLAAGATLEYLSNGFTRTYLESIGDINEYGIFIVGSSIGAYMITFSWAIIQTFQPDIFEAAAKRDRRLLARAITVQLLLISLGVAAFIAVSPIAIDLLTAGRYMAATPYAGIIAVTAITSAIFYIVNDISIVSNHQHLYAMTTIIGSALIIIMMGFATKHYGFTGGAWVNVLSFLVLASVNLLLLALSRIRISLLSKPLEIMYVFKSK